MSDLVRDAIAASLADLERVQDAPVAPFAYGSDLSCDSDLDERMSEVDPASTLAIGQAIARRLDCPRGRLPDDPDYGLDLRSYLNRGTAAADLRALTTQIRNEVSKDDRVAVVTVKLTPDSTGSSLAVDLAITPADASGEFSLTLAVTSSAVVLDAIRSTAR